MVTLPSRPAATDQPASQFMIFMLVGNGDHIVVANMATGKWPNAANMWWAENTQPMSRWPCRRTPRNGSRTAAWPTATTSGTRTPKG